MNRFVQLTTLLLLSRIRLGAAKNLQWAAADKRALCLLSGRYRVDGHRGGH
jgi:hypothetical protein